MHATVRCMICPLGKAGESASFRAHTARKSGSHSRGSDSSARYSNRHRAACVSLILSAESPQCKGSEGPPGSPLIPRARACVNKPKPPLPFDPLHTPTLWWKVGQPCSVYHFPRWKVRTPVLAFQFKTDKGGSRPFPSVKFFTFGLLFKTDKGGSRPW